MSEEKKMTGYPSIDKPWLKYYDEKAINGTLPKKTMYQYAFEKNKDNLSEIALVYFGKRITYSKLFENVYYTAKAFVSMGIEEGDIVTIMSMHTPETIYAIYALNYIGATANLVYMTLSENELIQSIENTKSKMLLVLDAVLERITNSKIEIPVIVLPISNSMPFARKAGYLLTAKRVNHNYIMYDSFVKKGLSADIKKTINNSELTAVIVYTSGTTGESKGVCLSSYNINTAAYQYIISGKNYKRNETFLDIVPTFLAFGVIMMHLSICAGITNYICIYPEAEKSISEFFKIRPNRFVIGPAYIEPLISKIDSNIDFLVDLSGGGGGISEKKERELNYILKKYNSKSKYTIAYAMTECSAAACSSNNTIYKFQSAGIPLPQTTIKIIDSNSYNELTYNTEGEICICAPSVMKGYYNNLNSSKDVLFNDDGHTWLRTGDLGYIDNDGFLFITGRIKRIYITKASDNVIYKLFPQRIEELLESTEHVIHCGVIVKNDSDRINVPIAFVECNAQISLNELWTISKVDLPEHMQPVDIIKLDKMPLTLSGKIDYRSLEKMAEEEN